MLFSNIMVLELPVAVLMASVISTVKNSAECSQQSTRFHFEISLRIIVISYLMSVQKFIILLVHRPQRTFLILQHCLGHRWKMVNE